MDLFLLKSNSMMNFWTFSLDHFLLKLLICFHAPGEIKCYVELLGWSPLGISCWIVLNFWTQSLDDLQMELLVRYHFSLGIYNEQTQLPPVCCVRMTVGLAADLKERCIYLFDKLQWLSSDACLISEAVWDCSVHKWSFGTVVQSLGILCCCLKKTPALFFDLFVRVLLSFYLWSRVWQSMEYGFKLLLCLIWEVAVV